MKGVKDKNKISKDEVLEINKLLKNFNNFLIGNPETDKNIGFYEYWLNIQEVIENSLSKLDLSKINESLVKFDYFISSKTKEPTDENIGIYENWIDTMYDIQKFIIEEQKDYPDDIER